MRAGLETVTIAAGVDTVQFYVTRRHCAAVQLAAALREIEELGEGVHPFFQQIGGSFAWRYIASTERLSTHSFGIAIDINTELGQYWRWSGANNGDVGAYQNQVPKQLVEIMERYGFIWGGKWHHYDGMHFEYRPEMILYSRLMLYAK